MTSGNKKPGDHFSRQARLYAESLSHAADSDLDIIENLAEPGPNDIYLDIATGTGHTALRIAPRVQFTLGVDASRGMLAEAERLAVERGVENIFFLLADAHAMPFPPGSFDIITCRIAAHHFKDVGAVVKDIARVLSSAGRFIVEDNVLPDDPKDDIGAAEFLDSIDRERDPTHVQTLTRSEWLEVIENAGLEVTDETTFLKRLDYIPWLERAGMEPEEMTRLTKRILSAPPKLVERFFEVNGESIKVFTDTKIILRAEHK